MHNRIKACLFDLDGVLIDTAKYHFIAWRRLSESLGIEFTEHDNEQLKGVSRVESLDYILRKGNMTLSEEEKQILMDTKNTWYLELVATMHPDELLPNVWNFLTELQQHNIKIGLGSSSKNAQMILDKTGIAPFFDTVVDGRHVVNSKPHPEVFLKGAAQLNVATNETIVFEDAVSGIAAALAGGFYTIGIGEKEILSAAHLVIPSLEHFTYAQFTTLPFLNYPNNAS
ncbi:MAG: beta-phosphoglucomutase [Bacteroidota bacterium]